MDNDLHLDTLTGDSMSMRLHRQLGRAIVRGEFDLRPFPTEMALAAQCGTSRTVTREAMKMLAAKGLIRSRPRMGTAVSPMVDWNLFDPEITGWLTERPRAKALTDDFTHMRLAIEPHAAALVARQAGLAAVTEIGIELERLSARQMSLETALEAVTDFHLAILRASGNTFFWNLRQVIQSALALSAHGVPVRTFVAAEARKQLFQAIQDHDPVEAERLMRDLVTVRSPRPLPAAAAQ